MPEYILHITWILGVLAALTHATAYILYNMQTKRGKSKPNIISWSIWALMAGMNFFTFAKVSSFPHALQYMVGTFAAVITFVLAWRWKRFDWPNRIEQIVFVLCLGSIGAWWYFKDASVANLIMMIPFLLSCHPTLRGVYDDPSKETPRSWWIWTGACSLTLLNNIISWNSDIVSVFNPTLLLAVHMAVALLAHRSK